MPRILSIDFGSKRCGIAVTDESQIIASGLTTIETDNLIDFLKTYFRNEDIELIVVGMPKNMLNQNSLIEPLILKYIKIININFPTITIERFDERFTSKLAFRAMIDGGLKKKKRKIKATIDMVSATIILQDYLHSRKI
ncbi:Holliday junction resolvase RuvX [Flavobacteriaceae bacterium]|jgi:putative Holliday junction resolvase|nr:Holliday junction resolvase RuvX [Flavobacteriaceae bacterium]MDB4180523.1 Holliday junction resolvase RuvX [Flavobacteriaceae bacterium]MDC0623068.1 Holliday junction resolvase RuvX [Flavobacteriaceae bacterium]|tara:strand:+ start:1256 stop:1672 length:417 start_codon:yes stop_codon:yes gene_type:complete